jgi:Smr domain
MGFGKQRFTTCAPCTIARAAISEAPRCRERAVSARVQEYIATLLRMPPLDRFAGIDRANAERLKCSLHKIEAHLDLHGMTQADAHRALSAFIAQSRDAARRCVLVVTGRTGVAATNSRDRSGRAASRRRRCFIPAASPPPNKSRPIVASCSKNPAAFLLRASLSAVKIRAALAREFADGRQQRSATLY